MSACLRYRMTVMAERFHLELQIPAQTVGKDSPVRLNVHLSESERHTLCERFSFLALASLEGKITLRQIADDCWHMSGRLQGQVTQACVVSGQPINNLLQIELDERFVNELCDQVEIEEMDADLLVDDHIPVGESLAQCVGVCAPAWPRASEISLSAATEADKQAKHPFARLSELKK